MSPESQVMSTEVGLYVAETRSEYGFENLKAWQKARALVKSIYDVTRSEKFGRDWSLQGQMRRAAVSVLSNIAEGAERSSDKEFARFLSMAKGSCAELRAQVIIAYDVDYLSKAEYDELRSKADEVSRLVGGLLVAVRSRYEDGLK